MSRLSGKTRSCIGSPCSVLGRVAFAYPGGSPDDGGSGRAGAGGRRRAVLRDAEQPAGTGRGAGPALRRPRLRPGLHRPHGHAALDRPTAAGTTAASRRTGRSRSTRPPGPPLRAGDLRGHEGVPAGRRRRSRCSGRRATPPGSTRSAAAAGHARAAGGRCSSRPCACWSPTDSDWVPSRPGQSLYLRPLMIATEAALGVRPADGVPVLLIASPGRTRTSRASVKPVTVWLCEEYTRAAPGGTGDAKCGGNYAAGAARPGGRPARRAATRSSGSTPWSTAGSRRWAA